MTDQIQANYEDLQTVIDKFNHLHETAKKMQGSLETAYQSLQDTWSGDAFDAFSREAEECTGPAAKRLIDAMEQAAQMTKLIAQTFHDTDEECSNSFSIS